MIKVSDREYMLKTLGVDEEMLEIYDRAGLADRLYVSKQRDVRRSHESRPHYMDNKKGR